MKALWRSKCWVSSFLLLLAFGVVSASSSRFAYAQATAGSGSGNNGGGRGTVGKEIKWVPGTLGLACINSEGKILISIPKAGKKKMASKDEKDSTKDFDVCMKKSLDGTAKSALPAGPAVKYRDGVLEEVGPGAGADPAKEDANFDQVMRQALGNKCKDVLNTLAEEREAAPQTQPQR